MSFAYDLKKEMTDLRIQRQQIAEIVGISEPMVTHLSTGRRKPSPETARAIMFVFHVITTQQQQTGRFPLTRENIRFLQRGIREMEASIRVKVTEDQRELAQVQ